MGVGGKDSWRDEGKAGDRLANAKLAKGTGKSRDPVWGAAERGKGASGVDTATLTLKNNTRPWVLFPVPRNTHTHTHTEGGRER